MKRKSSGLVGLVLTIVAGWMYSAEAGLIVSYSNVEPTNNIITSHVPTTSLAGYEPRYITTNAAATQWRRDMGQYFVAPSNFVMQAYSLKLWSGVTEVASEAPTTIRVYESATEPAGTLAGTDALGSLIFTQSTSWLSSTSGAASNSWVTFETDDIVCTAGKYYTVFFNFDNQVDGMSQWFYSQQSGTYADGRMKAAVDANAIAANRFTDVSTNRDLVFIVHGIPEPATMGLLGMGSLLALIIRRYVK